MKKQIYIAPELEVLEIQIEHGFAGSDGSGGDNTTPVDNLPGFGFGGW